MNMTIPPRKGNKRFMEFIALEGASLPAISVGQFDDKIYDDGEVRIWRSRIKRGDVCSCQVPHEIGAHDVNCPAMLSNFVKQYPLYTAQRLVDGVCKDIAMMDVSS